MMYKDLTICINGDEIQLHCRTWIPSNPQGLVIFIHGAGEHSGHYSHVGVECLNRGIGFIAPDLRGFGKSGGSRGHIFQFQDYLNDLDSLVEQFRKQYPGKPVYLFGHSLGGLIVIRYMQQFPNRADGVILSSPVLGLRLKMPHGIRKCIDTISWLTPALPLELIKWNESLRKLRWFRSKLPSWTSELLHDPLNTIRYTPRWFTELLHNGARALSEANRFLFPALCLYDMHDPIVDTGFIAEFLETINSKDKAIVVFDERDHRPLHGHHRDQALEHVFGWLCPRL